MRAAVLASVAVLAVLIAACGDDDTSKSATTTTATSTTASTATLTLVIRFNDGTSTFRGGLVCKPGQERATGELAKGKPAADRCRDARSLARFLTTKPSSRRVCTQLYGGPETARVTGTIDGRTINRRFGRTNGCEIKEYTQLKALLP